MGVLPQVQGRAAHSVACGTRLWGKPHCPGEELEDPCKGWGRSGFVTSSARALATCHLYFGACLEELCS